MAPPTPTAPPSAASVLAATRGPAVALFGNDDVADSKDALSDLKPAVRGSSSRRSRLPAGPVDTPRPASSKPVRPTTPSRSNLATGGNGPRPNQGGTGATSGGGGGMSRQAAAAQEPVRLRFAVDVLDDETSITKVKHVRPSAGAPDAVADALALPSVKLPSSSPPSVLATLLGNNGQANGGGGTMTLSPPPPPQGPVLAGMLSDPQVAAARIQSAWATFSRLSDHDRDVFLHGILAQCGSSQVERICSDLHLRLSTMTVAPLHVHTTESHAMLARSSHNRVSVPVSQLRTTAAQGTLDPDVPVSSPLKRVVAPFESSSSGSPRKDASPKPNNNSSSSSPKPPAPLTVANANMYLKLFPRPDVTDPVEHAARRGSKLTTSTRFHTGVSGPLPDADLVASADPETVRQLASFTAARCAKLEATLCALNQASATPDVHAAAAHLMRTVAEMLGAQYYAIYTFNEVAVPPDAGDGNADAAGGRRMSRRASVRAPPSRRSSRSPSILTPSMAAAAAAAAMANLGLDGMPGMAAAAAATGAARGSLRGGSLSSESDAGGISGGGPGRTQRAMSAGDGGSGVARRVVAAVECSNWLPVGKPVSTTSIFGYEYLAAGGGAAAAAISVASDSTFVTGGGAPGQINATTTSPMLNVYHATASEHFTNACHEAYPEGVQCFLSAALVSEAGRVTAVLELANKQAAASAPFFDVEDEFVLRSTLATWSLVLKEAQAERDRDQRDQMLRRILADLQAMSRVEQLHELVELAEKSVAQLVSAERVAIHLDLSVVDVDDAVRRQLRQGEPVLIAHAMSIPKYRSRRIRNLLMVPIMADRNEVSGVIVATNKFPDTSFFVKQDQDNMASFAPLIAVLIYRAKRTYDTTKVMTALENKFALATDTLVSQDGIVLRVNEDLWITDSIAGTLCHAALMAQSDTPLMSVVDTHHEVFYEDLRSCLSSGTPRFNGEYPMRPALLGGSAATDVDPVYVDYSVFPSHLQQTVVEDDLPHRHHHQEEKKVEAIVVLHASTSSRRVAQVRSRLVQGEASVVGMVRDPSLMAGARDNATVLLVNLHEFSVAALMLSATQLTGFLAKYYAAVHEVAAMHGGMVLSTNNDRVTCIFGLPIASPDDAARAIRSGLALLDHLRVLLPAWLQELDPDVRVSAGVALTSGLVAGGMCQFRNATNYSVIGEPVHLASKLEAVARIYGAPMLMDRSTHEFAKKAFETREVDVMWFPEAAPRPAAGSTQIQQGVVHGVLGNPLPPTSSITTDTVEPGSPASWLSPVYDVIGRVNDLLDNDRRTGFICYELGLGEYRQRNFDAALTYFRKCKSLMPEDGPSSVMIDRCRAASDDPTLVPVDWDGLWRWDIGV
ncbi:cGMP-dependent 3',5'-cyclic phosphodiesterase [Blastocladiella emersonii ATCC 22665]|nr:cGMP-dependent 3',5'-cyclic phosphodiesterase [Blastocladiella emersonii ATCC 22665]